MSRLIAGAMCAIFATLAAGALSTAALAQHDQMHMHMHGGAPVKDEREFVKFPPQLVAHTLANMRDHLVTLQEIQESLAKGDTDAAAKVAEARLGMSSLGLHGAHDVAPFMPQGMQDAGTAMHKAASRFAVTATDAGVTNDYKAALAGLAEVTATCVACHAGYKIK